MNRNSKMLMWVLIAIIAFSVLRHFMSGRPSGYRSISIDSQEEPDFFLNKTALQCVAGPGPEASYYSDSMGGICGDQQYVHKMGHQYTISDGVGGSLLSM